MAPSLDCLAAIVPIGVKTARAVVSCWMAFLKSIFAEFGSIQQQNYKEINNKNNKLNLNIAMTACELIVRILCFHRVWSFIFCQLTGNTDKTIIRPTYLY